MAKAVKSDGSAQSARKTRQSPEKGLCSTPYARPTVSSDPNIQQAASNTMKAPRRADGRNSEKYENTTGIDPPTLYIANKQTNNNNNNKKKNKTSHDTT